MSLGQTEVKKLPLFGQLNINDLFQFLCERKAEFYESLGKVYKQSSTRLEDFDVIAFLGRGTFASVYLVTNKKTKANHAMKLLQKSNIVKTKQVSHVWDEKNISLRLNFPFVIYLDYAFHDNSNIYFVMPFITGGELFDHLKEMGHFVEEQTKFITAQVVLGIEYLHFLNVAYRDMKPENIMIDQKGYIKLSDFSFAKVLKNRTYTFCGTPEYLAPEVVTCQGYGLAADWWAFGVILYELSSGHTPFRSRNQLHIFEKAANLSYKFPKYFSDELKDLIQNTIQPNLTRRYGNLKNGVNDIKQHPWFKQIMWMSLLNRQIKAPFVPDTYKADGDNVNKCKVLPIEVSDRNSYAKYFEGF